VLEKLLNMIEVIVFATRAFVFSAFFMKKCNFGFKTANSPVAYVVALYSGIHFRMNRTTVFSVMTPLKSVMSASSAWLLDRANRSVHGVHEDFEHHATQPSECVTGFESCS